MAKFSKNRGSAAPEVSTASLPDIIFILLFFFMVTTVMRDSSLKVEVHTPFATELTKLQKKSLVNYLYIGKPMAQYQNELGSKPRLQLGDKVVTGVDDIALFLQAHKLRVPEGQQPGITSSLRVDADVTMGIVSDIKVALRKAGQLKVNYSAKRRQE